MSKKFTFENYCKNPICKEKFNGRKNQKFCDIQCKYFYNNNKLDLISKGKDNERFPKKYKAKIKL
jgi:hypothetical protein